MVHGVQCRICYRWKFTKYCEVTGTSICFVGVHPSWSAWWTEAIVADICFVNNRMAKGLSEVLKQSLQPSNLENKLMAQAYDGAAIMSGNQSGIQTLMQKTFPYAKFVHCYAHQLNLVIKKHVHNALNQWSCFFANITGFIAFFSTSPNAVTYCDLYAVSIYQPFQQYNGTFSPELYPLLREIKRSYWNASKGLKREMTQLNGMI